MSTQTQDSFAKFKQSQASAAEELARITGQFQSSKTPTYTKPQRVDDPTLFKITKDTAGNNLIIGRFLPNKSGGPALQKRLIHSIKTKQFGKDANIYTICPKTLGKQHPCPICEKNWEFYAMKDLARSKPLRNDEETWVNFYVISDDVTPANNGKVFKFRISGTIEDKIVARMAPLTEADIRAGIKPVNLYSLDAGLEFILKVKQATFTGREGYPVTNNSFKESMFRETPSSIGDETRQREIFDQMFDLSELVKPELVKSYENLKDQYLYVVEGVKKARSSSDHEVGDTQQHAPSIGMSARPPVPKAPATPAPVPQDSTAEDDEDSFFKALGKKA